MRIRRRGRLRTGLLRQRLPMHGEGRSNPERIYKVIPARVRRVRVDQNAQAAVVKHQPRHQRGKQLRSKGHLKHCLIVGTYLHVMPAPQGDGKTLAYPSAQALGLQPRSRRIVIDVSVVACDLAGRSRGVSLWQIGHLNQLSLHASPARTAYPAISGQNWPAHRGAFFR